MTTFPELSLEPIIEGTSDAIISSGFDGRVLAWNRGAERLLGFSAGEMVGQPARSIVAPARRRQLGRLLARVRQGETAELETVGIRHDGKRIDIGLRLLPLRDQTGRVRGTSAIARKVTAPRRAHERLQSMLESAPDAIVVSSPTGEIVLVNTQTEDMFGFTREQLIGRPVEILIPERFQEQYRACCEQYARRPHGRLTSLKSALTGVRAGGLNFPIEVAFGAIESEDGVLVSTSIRDVTERHLFQEALREKNVQLKAALEAKDRFMAAMSHELRTPLNAIIGMTGLMMMQLKGPLTPDQQRQVGIVQSSARHLLAMVNDLLDLARIESGKTELQLEAVSCGEVLEEVGDTLAPLAEQRALRFSVNVPDAPVMVQTDRRLLTQILLNLANNAVKFTDEGTVSISLEPGERSVRFAVTDTGIGIRAEDQEKLFREFARVSSEESRSREGTGLGLHLSQRLARLLGGRIELESAPGKGSTFRLVLERATASTQTVP
jgi:protein-histidine pros-kinase